MESKRVNKIRLLAPIVLATLALLQTNIAVSANDPFAGGWVLDTDASSLTFQSIKNESKAETSSFASYQGAIDEQGNAEFRIQLDSIDTKVDLRNVRMRFLFFETFKYQEAVITAKIDPQLIKDLPSKRRMRVPLTFDMNLHGVTKTLQVDTNVTMFSDSRVSVASISSLPIGTGLFGLDEGLAKLQEAASVQIVPVGSVNFDFVFNLNADPSLVTAAVAVPAASTALESTGQFSQEECVGRFQILSQTGAIYFRTSSAALDPDSAPLLETIHDVISRCPQLKVIVSGHTDSLGDETANLDLSFARADSVLQYLISRGVDANRIRSVGYGEARPIAPNNTRRNRSRNRRIEFSAAGS